MRARDWLTGRAHFGCRATNDTGVMMRACSWLGWLALCGALLGCGDAAGPPPVVKAPIVTVSHPAEIEVVDNYYFEGYTAAVSSVDIRARVTGYLSKIYFQDGADVKEGDPLFLIDPRPYQAELDQAKAELARVEAQLKRLDADYARAEKLLPNRTITKEDFDKIAADRAEAQAEVKSRQASIEKANLDLHFAAIKAPISGRISRRLVTEGNLIAANQTLLTTIVSIKPIYAYFDVDEPTVLKVRKLVREGKIKSAKETDMPVYLGLDIDNDYPYRGSINFIENKIDQKTGTLKLRAVFPNDDEAISPGLHARIKLPLGEPYKALAVPERAIGTRQGNKFLYVIDAKNEVAERPVTLGTLHDGMRVIAKGVESQDRVIVDGLQRVRPHVVVDPREAQQTARAPADEAPAEQAK